MSACQQLFHFTTAPILPAACGADRDQPAVWRGARLESTLWPLHPPPLKVVATLGNSTMHPSLSPRLVSTDRRAHLHSTAITSKSATDHNSCCNSHCHRLNIYQCFFSTTYSLLRPLLLQLNLHKVTPCNSKNHLSQSHLLRLTSPNLIDPSTTPQHFD